MNTRNKLLTSDGRGFTIIEVVLVLAIAGLIFLMVFIALPALQKGQRDSQRKSDLSRVSTQLTSYSGSTRGNVPTNGTTLQTFVRRYLGTGATGTTAGNEYKDPNGNNYVVSYNAGPVTGADNTIYYGAATQCSDTDPGNVVSTPTKPRNYTLRIKLENQAALYCMDNR